MIDSPTLRTATEVACAAASPASLAKYDAPGFWVAPNHIQVMDRAILDAVDATGPDHLLFTMPPRHGKSEYSSKYLPGWYLGTFPDRRVILTSYAAEFASSWGRKCRDLVERCGPEVFGVSVADAPAAANNWAVRSYGGGMTTAGAGGQITGKGANLLIADDPIKNAEEASSRKRRDKIWDWWNSTAYTRREPGCITVVIQTRWHDDDLAGRLLKDNPGKWRVIDFPALSEDGAALWPGRFTSADLMEIRQAIGSYYWSALYQQNPIAEGWLIFQRDWLQVTQSVPSKFDAVVRYWDKAGSELSSGDYSAGVLMGRIGYRYFVLDVVHGRWSPFRRNEIIAATAAADRAKYGAAVQLWIEQEPGNGGKESAMISGRELAAYGPHFEVPSVDKVVRARPFAARCEALEVFVTQAEWTSQYIQELVHFPNGEHDDRVDATSGGFNKVAIYGERVTRAVGSYSSQHSTITGRPRR